MANRGVSLNPGYRPGSHWSLCDFCGSQFRAEELRLTWDGFYACNDDFEVRHPQDFLRAKEDKISADQPLRPENTSVAVQVSFSRAIDISQSTYTSKSFSINTEVPQPFSIRFDSTGTIMYGVPLAGGAIYQYTLSTPWDISTTTYASKTFDTGGTILSLAIKPDGTKAYVIDHIGSDTVKQYTFDTAWDISTLIYDSVSFDISSEVDQGRTIDIDSSGTLVFILDATSDTVYQYEMGTAWDAGSLAYTGKSLDISSLSATISGSFYVSNYPESIWFTDSVQQKIYQFSMSDNDISNGGNTGYELDVSSEETTPICLFIGGSYLYLAGTDNDTVYQYELSYINSVPDGTFNTNTL